MSKNIREQGVIIVATIEELPATDVKLWQFALVDTTRYQWDGTAWVAGWGSGGVALNKSGDWRFRTQTTFTDPGTGNISFNNADPSLVTEIYISATTDGGGDASSYLNLMRQNSIVYIQVLNDASKYLTARFDSDIVDQGDWYSAAVTVEDNGGLPSNNNIVHCDFFIAAGGDETDPVIPTSDGVLNTSTVPGPTVTAALDYLNAEVVGTYAEIKALRDASALSPGGRYTITDYQTKYYIEGSNSSGLKISMRVSSVFSPGPGGYLVFDSAQPLLQPGVVVTIEELPDGYSGPYQVGDTATCTTNFSDFYYRFDEPWEANEDLVGAIMSYAVDRYSTIAQDAIINDDNGRPIMQPNGVVNTDVHDGTPYMDMTADENLAVPTEILILTAASVNSFEPQGASGTFLGDTIWYDMDDDDILNDNLDSIGSRNGKIFRRRNLVGDFDLPIDWRVQRYRRYLLDEASRTALINEDSPRNAAVLGTFEVGEEYRISHVGSGSSDWESVGGPASPTVGDRFVATAAGSRQPVNQNFACADKVIDVVNLANGDEVEIISVGTTDYTLIGSSVIEPVVDVLEAGITCKIDTVGDTDFTLIGSPDNNVGTIFVTNGTAPLGTGTVDIGSNVGRRFTATGAGVGTGEVKLASLVRHPDTGDSLFTTPYRDPSSSIGFYIAQVPEEQFNKLNKWAQHEKFEVAIANNNKAAKDFTTFPLLSTLEPDSIYVTECVFEGEWDNVVCDKVVGGVYNVKTQVNGQGRIVGSTLVSGLVLPNASRIFVTGMVVLEHLNYNNSSAQFTGISILSLVATFFNGNDGSNFRDCILAGSWPMRTGSNDSFSWFNMQGGLGTQLSNAAISCRVAEIYFLNGNLSESAIFLGGQQGSDEDNPGNNRRMTINNFGIERTVLRLLRDNFGNTFNDAFTGFTHDNPRNQLIWDVDYNLRYKNLKFNKSNGQLISEEMDEDNVFTIETRAEAQKD